MRNSRIQLGTVDRGTTTRYGPAMCCHRFRYPAGSNPYLSGLSALGAVWQQHSSTPLLTMRFQFKYQACCSRTSEAILHPALLYALDQACRYIILLTSERLQAECVLRDHTLTYEGNTLDCLAQAHFISQDAIVVLHPGVNEPIKALQLVVSQRASSQKVWLLQQSSLRLCIPPLCLQAPHRLQLNALLPLLQVLSCQH